MAKAVIIIKVRRVVVDSSCSTNCSSNRANSSGSSGEMVLAEALVVVAGVLVVLQ